MTKEKYDSLPFCRKNRSQVLEEFRKDPVLYAEFEELTEELQEEALAFCAGEKGLKLTYDRPFKYIFNPEVHAERLSRLLSCILNQKVKVRRALPTESMRLSAEASLLSMDILVELMDGSLANVEIQRIGYAFPGERSACYSADMLLRQYARVKSQRKKRFSYRDLSKVYTIVLLDESSGELRMHRECYYHYGRVRFDTGVELNMLQEYVFICLDNYRDLVHTISSELDAWLMLLNSDRLEDIRQIVQAYPKMLQIYRELAEFQKNPEELIGMYSEFLKMMDRNTVLYMIDEQKKEMEELQKALEEKREELRQEQEKLVKSQEEWERSREELERSQGELKRNQGELKRSQQALASEQAKRAALEEEIARLRESLNETVVE